MVNTCLRSPHNPLVFGLNKGKELKVILIAKLRKNASQGFLLPRTQCHGQLLCVGCSLDGFSNGLDA